MSGSNDRSFNFEAAPELPGADRLSKYAFSGIRRLTHRLWDFTIEGRDNVPVEGPAIIAEPYTSTVVLDSFRCVMTENRFLELEVGNFRALPQNN